MINKEICIQNEMGGEGLLQYSTNAKSVLNTAGDKPIQKIIIKRSPVSKVLTGALSAFYLLLRRKCVTLIGA